LTSPQLGREVLDLAASHVKPGVTTDEIDEIVHKATIERDAYPSPLNYRQFPKSVCTSVNEVICHGIPDKRKLVEGDIINIGKLFVSELIASAKVFYRCLNLP
jgi:methionyl aminopeptidase